MRAYNSEISPVEKIAEALRAIALYDALATAESREVVHVLGELLHSGLETDVAPVDDVDAVAHRISYVLLHEAPEARQVRGDARYAHYRALGRRVTPRLVVRREDAQVATPHEFLVVEAEQRIG